MKIIYERGQLKATAESMEDIQTLLSLKNGKIESKVKPTKYKKLCVICGKRYKDVGLHKKSMHSKEQGGLVYPF